MKTDKQAFLELQRQKPIKDVIIDALNGARGEKNITIRVALDLGVSQATLYLWCHQFSIDIDEYRQQPAEETANV